MKRILHALAVIALLVGSSEIAHALTVGQVKEIEAKVKALVAKNSSSVVSLNGDSKPAAGSGVVVSADGLILTAAHVTQGNNTMTVIFPDGKTKKCKVLGANYAKDIGLAQITDAGPFPFSELGDSDKLEEVSMRGGHRLFESGE
jgi:serine protease Do